MRARFWQQAPPEVYPGAGFQRQAPPEAPLKAPLKTSQAPLEGPPEGPPEAAPQAYRTPEYHHCKLCNASFSSIARLIRHTQENICNKPSCRHCEMVFSSKNMLHRHLREDCQKQTHRHRGSSSKSSPSPSPRSSTLCSPTWPSTCLAACSPPPPLTPRIPSPPPNYRAISPSPPPYLTMADLSARYAKPLCLKVDDLFRMFRGSSATPKSSITIASDDPFARPFVFSKKSLGSTQIWELGLATSCHQIARAQCSLPRSTCERCRRPPSLLDIDKRQAMPYLV